MSEKEIPGGRRLIELLRTELEHYRKLLDRSQRQSELIEAGRMEALMPLLAEKQEIIDEIAAIEDELRPVKADWSALEGTFEAEVRSAAAEVSGQIEEVLGRIVELERSVEQALRTARKEVLDRMAALKDKGRATRAYGAGPKQDDGKTRFFDQKK